MNFCILDNPIALYHFFYDMIDTRINVRDNSSSSVSLYHRAYSSYLCAIPNDVYTHLTQTSGGGVLKSVICSGVRYLMPPKLHI